MGKMNGKHYCRCDAPDEKGRRSECGLPGVQCESCRHKDEIESLTQEILNLKEKHNEELCEGAAQIGALEQEISNLKQDKESLIDTIEQEVVSSVSVLFKPHLSGVFAVIRSKLNVKV